MQRERVPKRQVQQRKKDLQPISDRISSTMGRILLERGSKRAWRNVRCNQIKKNLRWLLERHTSRVIKGVAIQETRSQRGVKARVL